MRRDESDPLFRARSFYDRRYAKPTRIRHIPQWQWRELFRAASAAQQGWDRHLPTEECEAILAWLDGRASFPGWCDEAVDLILHEWRRRNPGRL